MKHKGKRRDQGIGPLILPLPTWKDIRRTNDISCMSELHRDGFAFPAFHGGTRLLLCRALRLLSWWCDCCAIGSERLDKPTYRYIMRSHICSTQPEQKIVDLSSYPPCV